MKKTIMLMLLTVLLVSAMVKAPAYMKLGDIKGEATDERHKDWINVESYSYELHTENTATARASTRAVPGELVIGKTVDKSTPKLAEAVATGKRFPTVEVELTRATGEGSETYLKYELKNVLITSYSVSGDADDRPTEELSLNYEEIKNTYSEYDDSGRKIGDVVWNWVLKTLGVR